MDTDQKLMISIQKGNSSAFEEIFNRHKGKVMGYLVQKTRDDKIAEDLLQSSFEKLYLKSHLYDTSQPFLPWFFTLINNSFIDFQRKVSRENLKIDHLKNYTEILSNDDTDTQDSSVDLSNLKEPYLSAIKLKFFEDKSNKEISLLLNKSEPNIRKIISRALQKLKEGL